MARIPLEVDTRYAKNAPQRKWPPAPTRDKAGYPELFHTSPRLDAVRFISQHVGATPYALFDKRKLRANRDAEPILDHPLYQLFDMPCEAYPEIDSAQLLAITDQFVTTTGEAFWAKIRGPRNEVIGLYILPPKWCYQLPTIDRPAFQFYANGVTSGTLLSFPADDIVYFKKPSLDDPYGRGRGEVEGIGDEIETDEYAAKWQKNYMYNDATPPAIVSIPGATQQQLEQVRQNWLQKVGGWLNARKPAFLNGDAKVTQLGYSAKEMDFIETRKFIRDTAHQHFFMSPELLGNIENSNRASIEAAKYHFESHVLKFHLAYLASTINRQLVAVDYDANLLFKFSIEATEDKEQRHKELTDGLNSGAITRAQWLKGHGMPFTPADEVYLIPTSVSVTPKDAPPEEAPVAPKAVLRLRHVVKQPATTWDERKIAVSTDKAMTRTENLFAQGWNKFAERQGKMIEEAYRQQIEAGQPPETAIDNALNEVFGNPGVNTALKQALAKAWINALKEGASLAGDVLNTTINFELFNPLFNAWVDNQGLAKAAGINETTNTTLRQAFQKTISEGIQNGEGRDKIAKRIMDVASEQNYKMTHERATLIAQTEACSSVNYGQLAVYKAEGVTHKVWSAALDGKTRETHMAADKASHSDPVAIDDAFDVGGEKMLYPGDPAGSASEVCRCRCAIIPSYGDAP